jgi:glyoxylase-like metal-dependent hydrolase (beta-lactamase superfamily II)
MLFRQITPNIFCWTDTCNVYVLRDGDSAILFDLGDGSVLNHLSDIGVKNVEWVLFTHHHREQCQGITKLKSSDTKIAVPSAERALFEHPTNFRKMKPSLGDALTVHGASYVRPSIRPIKVDHVFQNIDEFSWHGNEFWCINTRGNSPGSMSYMLKKDGKWIAFSGDVMMDGAKMHTWFDTEWDYGFAAGIYALFNSVSLIESFRPLLMLPSHGNIIRNPVEQLEEYQKKIREFERHYVRGYEQSTFGYGSQDTVSTPTDILHLWQVTPHIYKCKGPELWPNFGIILADSGHAFVVDCGLGRDLLDKYIEGMKAKLGLKQIDAAIITHYHGDHCIDAPYLREKYGAEIWALDKVAEKIQFPERFDYTASVNTYGAGVDSIEFDRIFTDGEKFHWEGYDFTVDWMPGQTEFGLCLNGVIDGKLVAFTGDNIFGSTTDPKQNGHEAVVARNSGILEEGYIYAGEYLRQLQPDIIIAGHSNVMDKPKHLIERFRDSAIALRDAFQALSDEEDYRYMFDPYWVKAEPYRVSVKANESANVDIKIRNFLDTTQYHYIDIHCPDGISTRPAIIEGYVDSDTIMTINLSIQATAEAVKGVNIIAFDISLDGQRYGELFDMIVNVI